ncbi:MAG TPA: disulfide bond formation protein B [Limnobacter sp.]|nr:disulfide bond formation protein B [Limnobacter sp.]
MRHSPYKALALFGLGLCVGSLGAALFLQITKGWFPCPLCIIQRYAYLVSSVGFLGLAFNRPRSVLSTLSGCVALSGFLGGLATAGYHVWVLANPLQTCGVDPLQVHLNALPWVSLWPDMFIADGLCTEEYPPLLGLSLPMWSGVGFVALGVILLRVVRAKRLSRRSW